MGKTDREELGNNFATEVANNVAHWVVDRVIPPMLTDEQRELVHVAVVDKVMDYMYQSPLWAEMLDGQ